MKTLLLSRAFLVALLLSCCTPLFAAQLDINKADAAVLASALSGVGPVKAEAIVRYRDANGPFASADDLVKVPGIGRELVERNRAVIMAPGAEAQAQTPAAEQ
ncbi:helix-hairpin-helix domain-containing protein [Granulosicoccaceae sp. 1_MG-2023]|nr:helix-hairpin-helix domain-containing protein [Granulosicoccaceae sp. 1_MG-2023]